MQHVKYVLFGAGQMGESVVEIIGRDNIFCFVDNNPCKAGRDIQGIKIAYFDDVREWLMDKRVIVTVGRDKKDEIIAQLKRNKIEFIMYHEELQRQILKEKLERRVNYIDIYKKAIQWIHENAVNGEGIINHSELKKSYPEVTGYYIPSLLCWGYRDLALKFARWLCRIQKEDGSWYDTDDKEPYIFDSAQIIKGLIAIRGLYPQADEHIKKGCNWILSNMREDGRLFPPIGQNFGDGKTYAEIIHIYCLSPLVEAADIFGIPEYKEKAYRILNYYKENALEEIMNFSLLSHFYAYVMEGLLDMGEEAMVRKAMAGIEAYQKETGSVSGYADVDWVCSTGLFQFSLIWFRLGNTERGNRAFEYACKLQNESGGWFGSYPSEEDNNTESTYFPHSEISWAVKYFLDALYWKNKAEFEHQASIFKDTISPEDGRFQLIEEVIKAIVREQNPSPRILDVGCGKGPYLKNLTQRVPQGQYAGVDISEQVMRSIQCPDIDKKQGVLTNIPYDDGVFDLVYSCEALEHAVDIESAVREMARVARVGGTIAIIDKNKEKLGYFEIGKWEQWFDEKELSDIMLQYCRKVEVNRNIGYEEPANGLFYAWIGKVK